MLYGSKTFLVDMILRLLERTLQTFVPLFYIAVEPMDFRIR